MSEELRRAGLSKELTTLSKLVGMSNVSREIVRELYRLKTGEHSRHVWIGKAAKR